MLPLCDVVFNLLSKLDKFDIQVKCQKSEVILDVSLVIMIGIKLEKLYTCNVSEKLNEKGKYCLI